MVSTEDTNRDGSAEVPAELMSDRNHWLVNLCGPVSGETVTRAYHLPAEKEGEARYRALANWGGEFDSLPFVTHCGRYYDWRRWETEPEGRQGAGREVTF